MEQVFILKEEYIKIVLSYEKKIRELFPEVIIKSGRKDEESFYFVIYGPEDQIELSIIKLSKMCATFNTRIKVDPL